MLVTVAAGLLVYPLIQGREVGWPAWTFASMGAAVAVLAVVVLAALPFFAGAVTTSSRRSGAGRRGRPLARWAAPTWRPAPRACP